MCVIIPVFFVYTFMRNVYTKEITFQKSYETIVLKL